MIVIFLCTEIARGFCPVLNLRDTVGVSANEIHMAEDRVQYFVCLLVTLGANQSEGHDLGVGESVLDVRHSGNQCRASRYHVINDSNSIGDEACLGNDPH